MIIGVLMYAEKNTSSLIIYAKSEDIDAGFAKDVKKRIHKSNYGLTGKNKKNIYLMKDGLGGEIMKEWQPQDLRCIAVSWMMVVLTNKQSE